MMFDQDISQNPAGPRKRASSTSEQPSRVAVRSQRSRLVGWLVDRRDKVVEDKDGGGGDSCDDGAVLSEVGISYQCSEAKSIKLAQQAN